MQHARLRSRSRAASLPKEIRQDSSGDARLETPRPPSLLHAVEPVWLTVSQLAQRWQLGRKTIYKFIDSGELPVWKVGTHLFRIALADILRFEARNRRPRR